MLNFEDIFKFFQNRLSFVLMGSLQFFLAGAFGFYAISGLALGYIASYLLLKIVAYLSPWLPMWMWFADIGLFVHAIAVAATSTVGIIAVLANKAHALKLCTYILVGLLIIEVLTTVQLTTRRASLDRALNIDLRSEMENSIKNYSINIDDTQMWDEIELEVNCCGVENYKDWFSTAYGNGSSVPDSCCLLVTKGCGQNIISKQDLENEIITKGCLPIIMEMIRKEFHYYGYNLWIPALTGQLILAVIIIYIVRKISASKPSYYPYILSDSVILYDGPKYQPLEEPIFS